MPARVLGSLGILIVAISAERFAYYGYHTFLSLALTSELSLSVAKMGAVFGELMLVSLFATLCAGALAFVLPPRLIAVIGAMAAALGLLIFALSVREATALLGVFVSSFGTGLVRPCTLAYAARVLTFEGETELCAPSGRRFLSLACFATLLLGMVNVSALLAPAVFGALMQRLGFRTPALFCVAIDVLVAVLFGASLLVDRDRVAPSNTPAQPTAYRTEPGAAGSATTGVDPIAIVAALGLAVPGALAYLVATTAERPPEDGDYRQYGWLQGAEGVSTAFTAFALFVVLLVLTQKRSPVSVALFVGGGYVAFGVSALLLLVPAFAVRLLGMCGVGFSEPLYALGVVFAALAVRGKAATVMIGGFLLIQMLGGLLGGPLSAESRVAAVSTVGGVVLLLGAGIALMVLSRRIRALFEPA